MIKVLDYTPNPIQHIGACTGICYGSDTTNAVKNYNRGITCISDGHGRVLEYPSVTLEIDGYSIKVVRELYTHIQGVTRLQESTRYVNMDERGYVEPPAIRNDSKTDELYNIVMLRVFDAYNIMIKRGIQKEDASMILPLGMKTKIVLKINARALLHMAEMRMCSRAYWEFRQLMKDIQKVVGSLDDEWKEIADMMKPRCENMGFCTEHKSCGRKPKKGE